MRWAPVLVCAVLAAAMSCRRGDPVDPGRVVALERAALERWNRGDPQGYLEILAPEVTYFDPRVERRVNGLRAVRDLLVPIRGKVRVDRFEMIDPQVSVYGDVAVLTFNLVDLVSAPGGADTLRVLWNSTEVYRRLDRRWRIVHSHWSLTRPPSGPAGP